MSNAALEYKNITLVETLDRVLNKGVVLSGDVIISVADVDLIYLGLKVLLASVETAEKMKLGYKKYEYEKGNERKGEKEIISGGKQPELFSSSIIDDDPDCTERQREAEKVEAVLPKIDVHPDKIEKGLGRLVLTLIELIRKLMEKQALRRVEANSLSDEEVERLGETLLRLENKMEELQKVFGLTAADLNLNLGPLGDLV